jgi:hypothetical protein
MLQHCYQSLLAVITLLTAADAANGNGGAGTSSSSSTEQLCRDVVFGKASDAQHSQGRRQTR